MTLWVAFAVVAVVNSQQLSVCSSMPIVDVSFSSASTCFEAYPGTDNSLTNVGFNATCSFSGDAMDVADVFSLFESGAASSSSDVRGQNDCYFAGAGYSSQVIDFPACMHLSNKPNCRIGGGSVDYNPLVTRVMCAMAQAVYPKWNLQSNMCFKTLQRLACSLFDPAMISSGGFSDFRMQLDTQDHVMVQQYRFCQTSACVVLGTECGIYTNLEPLREALCGTKLSTVRCHADSDCVGFNAGRHCIGSTLATSRTACVADCDANPCPDDQCVAVSEHSDAPVPAEVTEEPEEKGGGNVALIVIMSLIGAFSLYCCLGIVYKRVVQRATGRDQIPNIELWSGLARCCGNLCSRCQRRGDGYSAAPPPYDWN